MRLLWLNSGGPDSLLSAAMWRRDRPDDELESVYIDHNPHNRSRALAAAVQSAEVMNATHRVLPVGTPDWFWTNGRGYFHHRFQTLFLFTLAACEAHALSLHDVLTGYKPDINSGPEYVRRFQELLNMSTMTVGSQHEQVPYFHLPLTELETHDLEATVALAEELGVSLAHTWSCNRVPACGTCVKCQGRMRVGLLQE